MNRICRRAVAAAGALALAGGTALAATAPASAATVIPAFPGADNFSYGASGPFAFELGLAENSFGQHVVTLGHFSVLSHLVSGGSVADTAFDSGASSSVAAVNVRTNLAAVGLTASLVHSSCSDNGPTFGSTTILGGVVGVAGFGLPVSTFPSIDQPVHLPGGITVLLNDQVNNGDSLTVNAMLVELPGGVDVSVGTSVCDEDN